MSQFNFYLPIQIRYADLDTQWHVNNARTLVFIEQGRFSYLRHLNLWDGIDFFSLGLIVADVHISYQAPIFMEQAIRVGVRVSKMGNKSLTFEYRVEDETTGQSLATAETIMVAFDYHAHASIPVPQDWRQKISAFEGLS